MALPMDVREMDLVTVVVVPPNDVVADAVGRCLPARFNYVEATVDGVRNRFGGDEPEPLEEFVFFVDDAVRERFMEWIEGDATRGARVLYHIASQLELAGTAGAVLSRFAREFVACRGAVWTLASIRYIAQLTDRRVLPVTQESLVNGQPLAIGVHAPNDTDYLGIDTVLRSIQSGLADGACMAYGRFVVTNDRDVIYYFVRADPGPSVPPLPMPMLSNPEKPLVVYDGPFISYGCTGEPAEFARGQYAVASDASHESIRDFCRYVANRDAEPGADNIEAFRFKAPPNVRERVTAIINGERLEGELPFVRRILYL